MLYVYALPTPSLNTSTTKTMNLFPMTTISAYNLRWTKQDITKQTSINLISMDTQYTFACYGCQLPSQNICASAMWTLIQEECHPFLVLPCQTIFRSFVGSRNYPSSGDLERQEIPEKWESDVSKAKQPEEVVDYFDPTEDRKSSKKAHCASY